MPDPIPVALIGLGRWGKNYLKTLLSLREHCRVTHVCTEHPDRIGSTPYPIKAVASWKDLLAAGCKAWVLAVPPAEQPAILSAAVKNNIPCLAEKPLCLDLKTAEELHAEIERSSVPVLVDHIHLFNPWYQALAHNVRASGEKLHVILSEGGNLGPFHEHTPALWDWAPHDISLCLDLAGALPVSMDAVAGPPAPREAPELAAIRLDFPYGLGAWIHTGGLVPEKRRKLSVFTDSHWYRLDDLAEEKVAVYAWSFPRRYEIAPPELKPSRVLKPSASTSPLEAVVRYFFDGLAGGDRSRFGTGLAVEVIRILTRVESLMKRKTV